MGYEEFTGKTVDEALTQAAIRLGTTSANIEYEVIDNGSNGFLGIGGRPAKIKARVKTEHSVDNIDSEDIKEEAKADSKVVEDTKAVKAESYGNSDNSVVEIAEKFLNKVFTAMNLEVKIDINFSEKDRNMDIELSGDEMGILIGKRGQTIDSLQYLVSLVVNKESKEYVRVKVDTENYRERRKATLEELAKNIAYKVKRTKRAVSLEPMNPYERRIIHSALQDDKYVTTKSEGEEPYRHVIVLLKK